MKIQLEEQIKALPQNPGVYLFKDEQSRIIYVGKAANLNKRVRSYLGTRGNLSAKVRQLISKINDLEFIITDSEQEALILECNLIKKYHPRYNISLRDDKTFPYIKITINEEWPGVYITRHFKNDGAKYFGPFTSAASVRKTLKLIKSIFPFRSCTRSINETNERPCLEYYIHRCPGPCINAVSKQEYREIINQVSLFLEGKQELVLRQLKKKMRAAAQQFKFEKAALIRDQIQATERIIEGQRIAIRLSGEQDVIAMAQNGEQAYVEIFLIRNNKLIGHDHFIMEGIRDEKPNQIITSFIKQYYASASYVPPLLLLQYPVDEISVLTEWLKERRGKNIKFQVPQRGVKKRLVDIVAKNADKGLLLARTRQVSSEHVISGLEELKDSLCLPKIPLRIEGYDISDIQGTLAVGSMVVLEKGLPRPGHYRLFRIKNFVGSNDYAMIQEVLRRRFNRVVGGGDSWASIPDLILIDGGKGQLNAALEVMLEMGIDSIPIASLAKENEEVFIPGKPDPVDMPKSSIALNILKRTRDEAHRVAVNYHRKLRHNAGIASILDDIPGIGPKRRKVLLNEFGSIEAIKNAPVEKISQTKGITPAIANRIKEYL